MDHADSQTAPKRPTRLTTHTNSRPYAPTLPISRRRRPDRPAPGLLTGLLILGLLGGSWSRAAGAQSSEQTPAQESRTQSLRAAVLDPRYADWLRSVQGLISTPEEELFLSLQQDYRRDQFIQAFWSVRDPDPRTPVNELKRRWDETVRAGNLGFEAGDPRLLVYLLNGEPGRWNLPNGRSVARCFAKRGELEIWFYNGSERTARQFVVIFQRRAKSQPYEIWVPGMPVRPTQRGGLPTRNVEALCADDLFGYATAHISRTASYDQLIEEVTSAPQPSAEWLAVFAAGTTSLPDDAEIFEVDHEISFPDRRQSRTGVRLILDIDREVAPGRIFEETVFHHFLVTGEILREGSLFESFRYRFDGPTPPEAASIPLGLTRYLRPGDWQLRVKVEDVFANRFAQIVSDLTVPSPEGRPEPAAPSRETPIEGPNIELSVPAGDVLTGLTRFRATSNVELDKVTFFLDDRPVLSKRRPPYSVELDLGDAAQPHRVRVVGIRDEEELVTDQVWLNQGAQRFRVRLIEPRPGGIYPGSLTARVDVETPDGTAPESVDIYLDTQKVASLEEPPYLVGLRFSSGRPAVIRAVATLEDGTTSEDAVVIGTAELDERIAVRLVQVPAAVTDADGTPIQGLELADFTVREDGSPMDIQSVEWSADLPLSVALLVDRSSSIAPHIAGIRAAAETLASSTMADETSQLAVLSFADRATIDSPLSGDLTDKLRILAGLQPLGRTALWDALTVALNHLEGASSTPVVVLFTDGEDEISQVTLDQVVATATTSSATVYAVAPRDTLPDRATRRGLQRLAETTGGELILLDDLAGLETAFEQVLSQLRSRYLITVRSSAAEGSGPRQLDVDVNVRGAEVTARSSYSP